MIGIFSTNKTIIEGYICSPSLSLILLEIFSGITIHSKNVATLKATNSLRVQRVAEVLIKHYKVLRRGLTFHQLLFWHIEDQLSFQGKNYVYCFIR